MNKGRLYWKGTKSKVKDKDEKQWSNGGGLGLLVYYSAGPQMSKRFFCMFWGFVFVFFVLHLHIHHKASISRNTKSMHSVSSAGQIYAEQAHFLKF